MLSVAALKFADGSDGVVLSMEELTWRVVCVKDFFFSSPALLVGCREATATFQWLTSVSR